MSVFAISDIHLPCDDSKRMDVFGEKWKNHFLKISDDWKMKVSKDDIVLLPGDLSWAMTLDDVKPHIEMVCDLPGHKVFIKGNHDYWWGSLSKVKSALKNASHVVQNNCVVIENYIICGSRGWLIPSDMAFDIEKDGPIFEREKIRLRMSLEEANSACTSCSRIIVMMHYPPVYPRRSSDFADIISEYNVHSVVYGHLHGDAYMNYPDIIYKNIPYHLVSCDTLNFTLKKID